jgi:hypothetical protein
VDRVERLEHDLTAQLVATGLAVVGFAFTYTVLTVGSGGGISGRYAGTSEFTLWLFLSAAQTSFWCLVAWPLWQWCRSLLTAIPAGRPRALAGLSAAAWIVLIAVPIIAFDQREGIRSPLDAFALRVRLLSAIGLLVAVPAVLGFMALRVTAQDDSWQHLTQHAAIARYRHATDRLRGFLAVLGGMVTLAVVVSGARYQAENAFNEQFRPDVGTTPTQVLLVLGALLAGVLTLVYLPVRGALDALGHDLLDHYCPVPAVAGDDFRPGLERRREFSELLGLGSSARADLESAIVILSPLLGSLVATFLDTST